MLRSWGLVHPLLSLQFPQGTSLGPYRDTGHQLKGSSHLLLPFTLWDWREGRAEVSCPILAFRLLPRKGPSQSLSWDLRCARQHPSCSPTSPSSPMRFNIHPQLLLSTGACATVRHQHSKCRRQIAHGPQ